MDEVEGNKLVINLILFNDTGHSSYVRPLRESVLVFQRLLIANGVIKFIRTTRGDDESAACGQLAMKKVETRANLMNI